MAEPTSSSTVGLLYLFTVLLGPLVGPYVYVLFGATLGAATALSKQGNGLNGWAGAWFVVRIVLTSLLFTSLITTLILQVAPLPVELVMGGVAYSIGWKWDVLAERAWPWVLERLGIKTKDGEGTQS